MRLEWTNRNVSNNTHIDILDYIESVPYLYNCNSVSVFWIGVWLFTDI